MRKPDTETILVFATGDVGRDALAGLIAGGTAVEKVFVTRPTDDAILDLARENGLPAEVAGDDTQPRLMAEGRRYAWLLNLWGNQIFRREFLDLFDRTLNIHPSLVPLCRGADTATWILRTGVEPGVSLIEIRAGIDEGGVYAQRKLPRRFPETAAELQERLKAATVDLFLECWPEIRAGRLAPRPQDGTGSYHRRRDTLADRRREWNSPMTAGEVVNWILAHDFSPGTGAEIVHDGRIYRVRIGLDPTE